MKCKYRAKIGRAGLVTTEADLREGERFVLLGYLGERKNREVWTIKGEFMFVPEKEKHTKTERRKGPKWGDARLWKVRIIR